MALSDLEDLGILVGITAFGIVVVSFVTGLSFILRSRDERRIDPQRFLTGAGIIGLGAPWLGGVAQFLAIVLTDEPLDLKLQVYVSIWGPPLAGFCFIYLVLSLVKPEWKYYGLAAIGIINAIFLAFTYVLLPGAKTDTTIENGKEITVVEGIVEFTVSDESGLPDHRLIGIPGLLVLVYVLALIFVVGGVFLWVSLRTQAPEISWKARLVGIGCVLYGVLTPIDAFLVDNPLVVMIARSTIICSFSLIALGYTLPNWFRSRMGIPIS